MTKLLDFLEHLAQIRRSYSLALLTGSARCVTPDAGRRISAVFIVLISRKSAAAIKAKIPYRPAHIDDLGCNIQKHLCFNLVRMTSFGSPNPFEFFRYRERAFSGI